MYANVYRNCKQSESKGKEIFFPPIQMEVIHESYISAHIGEDGNLVVDECRGMNPNAIHLLFGEWIIEALKKEK